VTEGLHGSPSVVIDGEDGSPLRKGARIVYSTFRFEENEFSVTMCADLNGASRTWLLCVLVVSLKRYAFAVAKRREGFPTTKVMEVD
jgi:hypothetical protein